MLNSTCYMAGDQLREHQLILRGWAAKEHAASSLSVPWSMPSGDSWVSCDLAKISQDRPLSWTQSHASASLPGSGANIVQSTTLQPCLTAAWQAFCPAEVGHGTSASTQSQTFLHVHIAWLLSQDGSQHLAIAAHCMHQRRVGSESSCLVTRQYPDCPKAEKQSFKL